MRMSGIGQQISLHATRNGRSPSRGPRGVGAVKARVRCPKTAASYCPGNERGEVDNVDARSVSHAVSFR